MILCTLHAYIQNGDDDRSLRPKSQEEILQSRIKELEAKLIETEALLISDSGSIILSLESDLARAKLELANTEAERDELEVKLLNSMANGGNGNGREQVRQKRGRMQRTDGMMMVMIHVVCFGLVSMSIVCETGEGERGETVVFCFERDKCTLGGNRKK